MQHCAGFRAIVGGLAGACLFGTAAVAQVPEGAALGTEEDHPTITLPEPEPHWVYILEPVFPHLVASKVWILDGDTLQFKGMASAGYTANLVLSHDKAAFYLAETYWSRGTRGDRVDVSRVEIFRGQVRRRWSEEEKRWLVAETLMPGTTVRAVAKRHGVNTSQLFTWRKRFRTELGFPAVAPPVPAPPVPAFAAVEIAPAGAGASPIGEDAITERDTVAPGGMIEIDLPRGGRVRISGSVEPAVVTAALRALVRP